MGKKRGEGVTARRRSGGSLTSLPSWSGEEPRRSPTVPYPPNSLASCLCWNDVTGQLGMLCPSTLLFPFLSSASVPLWPRTISEARTNKQHGERVKHCKHKPVITDKELNSFHVYCSNLSLVKSHVVIVKPDMSPSLPWKHLKTKKKKSWFKPDVTDLISLAHENRCGPKEPRWGSIAEFSCIRCHHVSVRLACKSLDFPASFNNQPLRFWTYDECWIISYIHWCLKSNITSKRKQVTHLWPNKP